MQSLQSTGLALKQLQLKQSWVLGAGWTVPVLFSQLSALEHLCYHSGFDSSMHGPHLTKKAFPITELLHLQRLTHLDIAGRVVYPSSPAQQGTPGWAVLQFLQQLTRLEDLRLQVVTYDFQTGAMPRSYALTRLEVVCPSHLSSIRFAPSALEGNSRLLLWLRDLHGTVWYIMAAICSSVL